MRFEYYHDGLADVPKLSLDGTVANAVHFSHWKGNETPASVKADTSTEIALNLVAAPNREELTRGIDLVTNNHFDTDGVLSVWTVLTGERALELRDKLIAAAEAGDFSELSTQEAVRASIVIQGSDSPTDVGSPLARQLAGSEVIDEARAYELVLPHVERVLTRTNDYASLWVDPWNRIALALESFAKGRSRVEEDNEAKLSLVTLAPEIFSSLGFKPTRHCAPFTAISHHARGEVFLIATPLDGGWAYRIDYPYYSWAETVVRPSIGRRDFSSLIARLNEVEENPAGHWKIDTSELASAAKFSDANGKLAASSLQLDVVASELRNALKSQNANVLARPLSA
ncbi:MAG TPA: DUF6687 family protein [Pyrinomonadaceae bacterium]|nr:DUF6687 family protein [Pyrinomonadaceae bacterium]